MTPEATPAARLSLRVRADVEAAPWVVTAIKQLEAENARLREDAAGLDWLENALRAQLCKSCHIRVGGWLFVRADWDDDTKGWNLTRSVTEPWTAQGVTFRAAIGIARAQEARDDA